MANLTSTTVQISDNIAHVLLRRDGFDTHDRLQHNRASLPSRFFESKTASHLECDFRAVHFVVSAVDDLYLNIHHWITTKNARLRRLDDPIFDCTNVFSGDCSTNDLVLNHDAATLLTRLNGNDGVAILTAT